MRSGRRLDVDMPTTQLTIMRGAAVDDAGDVSEVGVPIYLHMPAALLEQSHTTFDPASSTRRPIRMVKALLPIWADVDTDDTLMDETSGFYYAIEDIQTQPS